MGRLLAGVVWATAHLLSRPAGRRSPPPAADEFTATGAWPPQSYGSEARRMVSGYVTTEHEGRRTAGTAGSVLLRTEGTDGYVVADAVRFVPA